ncbi:MAG: 30S ribosomal protein S1 [Bacteroidota bacterium]
MSEAQKPKEEEIETPKDEAVKAADPAEAKEEKAKKAPKSKNKKEEKAPEAVAEPAEAKEEAKAEPVEAKAEEVPKVEAEDTVEPAAAEAPVEEKASESEEVKAEEKEEAKTEPAEVKKEEEPKAEEAKDTTEEKPAKAKKEKKESKEVEPVEEEFDWDGSDTKGFGEGYSKEEIEKLEELYTETLNTVTEGEVVKATVVSVNPRDVILNIGFKSDGLVSASEFRDIEGLKTGDEVEVYVEEQENAQGQLVLSRRKAKIVSAWENIKSSEAEDTVIESMVKRRTKGGLIVDLFGVEAFLPGSQIDVKPIRDFDVFVGKAMEVKVVKINYSNDNVVVSHKVLIEKDLEAQRSEILTNLEKGQVLEGVIKNMTSFGVFIDLGGVDGLLHITDISWGRINHPEDILNLDETVKVVVLDFDEDKKRISLGMKQLTEHPWDSLPENIEIGSKVKGKIVNVADYGAFLEIQSGVEGLIHVSEMSWSQHLRNPSDFLEVGAEMEAVVLTIDRDERKMSLGIKQLTEDPWTKADVVQKYAVGTEHKGVVRNLTNFGLFIELEEGIDGLVHVSDLSWTKKIKHPSEFVQVGQDLEVQVLELDIENRRLALGHKQLEENPWDTFETVFVPGSTHKCTVLNKTDKGATLELPYGIEGFCTARNLVKEEGGKADVGETLEFVVKEFSKGDKRILLSHTATFREEEKPAAKKKAKKSNVKNLEATSSLGDLEALSSLKDAMEDTSKKKAPKATAKPAKAKKEEAPEAKAEEVAEPAEAKEEKEAKPAKKKAAKAKKEEVVEEKAEEVKAEAEEAVKEEPAEKAPKAEKAEAKGEEKEESSEEAADDKK